MNTELIANKEAEAQRLLQEEEEAREVRRLRGEALAQAAARQSEAPPRAPFPHEQAAPGECPGL